MNHTIVLTPSNPVLNGHKVHGRHLLPGLAYIDMLFQLLAKSHPDYCSFELCNLVIYQPLMVEPDEKAVLTIDWLDSAPDAWRIEVSGQIERYGIRMGVAVRYASAQMRRVGAPDFAETLSIAELEASGRDSTDLEDIYAGFREHELAHSDRMKAHGWRYATDTAVYVDSRVEEGASVPSRDFIFDPALIDSGVVCAGWGFGSGEDSSGSQLMLPISFESFRARAPVRGRCITRMQLGSARRKNDVSFGVLEFFDATGSKVAELTSLASKRVPESRLMDVFVESRPDDAVEWLPLLRQLVAEKLRIAANEVNVDANHYELGLQSAELLELVGVLEQRVGQSLPPTLLFEYTTLRELSAYLSTHLTAAVSSTSDRHARVPPAASPGTDVPEPSASETEWRARPAPPQRAGRRQSPDIAIISLCGRFPQAANLQQLWENLLAGRDCITEVPPSRWDSAKYFSEDRSRPDSTSCRWGGFIDGVDEFDAALFNISSRGAILLDPRCRLFLQTVWELLESAGYTRDALCSVYGGNVGVYVGSMYNHYGAVHTEPDSAALAFVGTDAAIANRTSHFFGLKGPSMAVDTMCSSAMTAVHLACKDLMLGECELAIAGGVNLSLHPTKYVGLSQGQLIATRPDSRSFTQGDGYLPAETVGAVLLKPLDRAVEDRDRIMAVIKATAVRHGGGANRYLIPDPTTQAQVIEEVLTKAHVDALSVSYVEAAAYGSPLVDAIELSALDKVFRKDSSLRERCVIGSVKSNIGHAEAASAISQLAKIVLQMRHRKLVPTIMAERLNPDLRLGETAFRVLHEAQDWEADGLRRALVNSFGAGGTYASALIEEYVAEAAVAAQGGDQDGHIVVISAQDAERLRAVVAQLLEYVEQHANLSLADFAYTLQIGREAMNVRLGFVVKSRTELLTALRAHLQGDNASPVKASVTLFTGDLRAPTNVGVLISGDSGDAIARFLVASRELSKIALLWTQGGSVPWGALHSHARSRLELPCYPFRRQRYWPGIETEPLSQDRPTTIDTNLAELVEERDATLAEQALHHIARFLTLSAGVPAAQFQSGKALHAYGLDSILSMQLARSLTQRFGKPVSGLTLLEHPTAEALAAYVAEHSKGESPTVRDTTAVDALERFKAGLLSRDEISRLIEEGSLQ